MFKRGVAGGLLRAAAGFYLVYYSELFSSVKYVLDEYKMKAYMVAPDALQVALFTEKLILDIMASIRGEIAEVVAALAAWLAGTLLFSASWSMLITSWPSYVRKMYDLSVWGLRAAAISAGVASYLIISGPGWVEGVVNALRLSWLLAMLYTAPLLAPIIYTLLSLAFSPRGRRLGLAFLTLGALLYAYSLYSVITAFRPLAEISPILSSLLRGEFTGNAVGDILSRLIAAAEVATDRLAGTVKALSLASIAYSAGFLLSEAGDEKVWRAIKNSLQFNRRIIN